MGSLCLQFNVNLFIPQFVYLHYYFWLDVLYISFVIAFRDNEKPKFTLLFLVRRFVHFFCNSIS